MFRHNDKSMKTWFEPSFEYINRINKLNHFLIIMDQENIA